MLKIFLQILSSSLFASRLASINKNYPNLKQENVIRNSILEILNDQFESQNLSLKAFAEHPRDKNSRVDLSIIDKNNLKDPYLVEFKFQYTNDFKQFINYKTLIDKDFQRSFGNKQSDLFILIISHWDKLEKHEFDNQWGLTSNLSRFLSLKETWRGNIGHLFGKYTNTELNELRIRVPKPYITDYEFFLISRTIVSSPRPSL